MNDKKTGPKNPTDAEIEREIRSRRKFSLAEAIGRNAGDLMKGASPVTRKRQAEFEIERLIEEHLHDAEGALAVTLLQLVKASAELLDGYDQPHTVLIRVIQNLLDSRERLLRFVTRVDAEWGRIYAERPHFETEGEPADVNDPYTQATVRDTLTRLVKSLATFADES